MNTESEQAARYESLKTKAERLDLIIKAYGDRFTISQDNGWVCYNTLDEIEGFLKGYHTAKTSQWQYITTKLDK